MDKNNELLKKNIGFSYIIEKHILKNFLSFTITSSNSKLFNILSSYDSFFSFS